MIKFSKASLSEAVVFSGEVDYPLQKIRLLFFGLQIVINIDRKPSTKECVADNTNRPHVALRSIKSIFMFI